MSAADITNVMAVAILIEMIAATIAVAYVVAVYLRSSRQSQIFRMLVRSDVLKVTAGAWIGFLAAYRLLNLESGNRLPDWTAPISAVVVAVLLAPPILHALTFRRLRKRYGDGTPPPLHEGD